MGVIMVDCIDKIPDSCFYQRDWPTEHYNFSGRAIIAREIANKILN